MRGPGLAPVIVSTGTDSWKPLASVLTGMENRLLPETDGGRSGLDGMARF
jgi:hypothetical protein